MSSYTVDVPILLLADALGLPPSPLAPQWGIYLDGEPVVDADSVVTFDYRQEWTVSDYPLEQGAFQSYDKVQTPFDVRVRYAAGGSQQNRQALLDSIAVIASDLNLYDIVTPEAVYQSVNVTHYDYRRTATNGVGLLQVDVWCVEVRVTAQAQFQNVQNPASASPQTQGNVQPGSSENFQQDFGAFQ